MNRPYYEESSIEKAVIGVCFLDGIVLDELMEFGVRDWWFRTTPNKLLWNAIVGLRIAGEAVDILTVTLAMEQAGNLSKLPAGPAYIAECAGEVATAENARHYATVFRKYVKLRMLDAFSDQMKVLVKQEGREPEEVMAFIKHETERIEQMVEAPTETLAQLYNQVFAEATRFDRQPPVATGFEKIDDYLGGLYPTELTILGGESGIGKTALLTCMLRNINNAGYPVCLFSLEMGSTILAMRVLSASARMPLKEIREGRVNVNKLYEAIAEYASETFYVKSDCWSMQEIEAAGRVLARTKGVKVFGVDYIQLVEGYNLQGRNREQEISGIGRALKRMAKNLGVHMLALSQLDDAWEGKPTGRNIRESKALKHHADNVLILYKPKNDDGRVVKCNIDKGRNKKTGEVTFGMIGGFTEFVNDPKTVAYYDERMR